MVQAIDRKNNSTKLARYAMRISTTGLIRRLAPLNREQRGITVIELAVIVLVLVGVASLFSVPDLMAKIRRVDTTTVTREELIEDSFASLILLGGVVGTADPEGNSLETVVFRVTSGGRSFSVVDISVSGATISYLDDYRAFNVPTSQRSSVWRRGNGHLSTRVK